MKKLYKSINLEEFKAQIDKEENINKPVAYDLLEELTFMKETMDELKATVQLSWCHVYIQTGRTGVSQRKPCHEVLQCHCDEDTTQH